MSLGRFITLAPVVAAGALSLSGEEVHCVGSRAHVLKYSVAGEPNDGSSLKGIENAILSVEPAPMHASKCDVRATGDDTPSGDKTLCYGVNQDSTCTSAKKDIPVDNGKFDCKDCFVGATADVFYKLNYTWDSLNSVEVGLKDMHVRGSASLHTHVSESATPVKGTKVLATNATKITLIDKLVGCPVCVKAQITVAAPTSVNYEIDLKAQADITVGAEIDINLGERSVKWDHKDGWTYPINMERSVTVKPLLEIGNVQADADVKLSIDTSLQFDVESIMWYHLNLKPSLPLTAIAKGALWPIHGAQFCLKGDADLTIGHEADLHWNLLTFKEYHHWGPVKDYDWSKSGIIDVCKNIGNLAKAATEDSTCAKPGDCGHAYQACCAGFAAKGIPCGCHLKDGTGATGADCGTCGSAYAVCCAGFKAKGFPCTCDISSGGDSFVV
jgi:hypothetical protein